MKIIGVFIGFAAFFAFIFMIAIYPCRSKASKMGFESSFGPIQGCMIKTKSGWVDIEKYRVVE